MSENKEPVEPVVNGAEGAEDRELTDADLDQVSGGTLSNLANMRHEMLKTVANNLRA